MRKDAEERGSWLWAALRAVGLGAIVALFAVAIMHSAGGVRPGSAAPPVVALGLDGRAYRVRNFSGRPVVLNFWATWCPACLAELADIERAHREFGDRVTFVGVALESGAPAKVAEVVRRFGLTYLVVVGLPETAENYRIRSFPTTVVVGPDGKVARTFASSVDYRMLRDALSQWL